MQGSSQLGVVPSVLERQGNFSQDHNATGGLILLKDPLASGSCSATSAAACFPGNIIPASRVNPIGMAVLNYFPMPNYPGVNNFLAYGITSDFWNRFLFKVDQKLGSKDNLAIRFSPDWETSVNPFSGSNLGTFPAITTVSLANRPTGVNHHMNWATLTHSEMGAIGLPPLWKRGSRPPL